MTSVLCTFCLCTQCCCCCYYQSNLRWSLPSPKSKVVHEFRRKVFCHAVRLSEPMFPAPRLLLLQWAAEAQLTCAKHLTKSLKNAASFSGAHCGIWWTLPQQPARGRWQYHSLVVSRGASVSMRSTMMRVMRGGLLSVTPSLEAMPMAHMWDRNALPGWPYY